MKPDLILSWPRACDYPLWREFLRKNRERFGKVIIVFTETYYGEDYRSFIAGAMGEDNCIFIDSPQVRGDQDWRNVAVKEALSYSNSNWLFFTEQDFLPTDDKFWTDVEFLSSTYDVFGVFQDTRLHPCCIFMKRYILKLTSRNFGVVPNELDHFGLIQKQIENHSQSIGKITQGSYNHMNGLSQNYCLLYKGEEPNYRPEEFKQYLRDCLSSEVKKDQRFVELAEWAVEAK